MIVLHSQIFHVRLALVATLISLSCRAATAITFTNNTAIPAGYTNYDGADIVITNCTVTVDGPHFFASLRVAAEGVLTHSFSPNGSISNLLFVTNESQVLTGTNPVTLLNSNVILATISVTDSTGTNFFVSGQDYLVTSPDGVAAQLQRTTNSTIPDGGTVLVNYEALLGTVPAGLNLTVAGFVEVDAGGAVNADGLGYAAGPGAGLGIGPGSGGAYGGNGGGSGNSLAGGSQYGFYLYPTNLGSGGGGSIVSPGGAGGGSVVITAGGSVTVNGSISANGANGTNSLTGGGSGGGIQIIGLSFSGSGLLTANGGEGEPTQGGGGGGGRILIQYNLTAFTGAIHAFGGFGYANGTAGTVYTRLNGKNGLLVFDNGGRPTQVNTTEFIQSADDVLIEGNASLSPITAMFLGALTVASNGFLVATPMSALNITADGPITVEAGGGIIANGAGNAGNTGAGSGHSLNDNLYRPGGGGGYGGNGASVPPGGTIYAADGGTSYGSQNSPVDFGSGGGSLLPYSTGGSGGGLIQITAHSIVQVDGVIVANGVNGTGSGGGGGSGGTISITSGTLLGSGSVTASGGSGANGIGGGGGGGRIYLDPTANLFSGNISAYGGGGGAWGGAGTVLIQSNAQSSVLILDNDGNLGTNTPLQTASTTTLIIGNGAVGSEGATITFANLLVSSNGWLTPVLTGLPGVGYMNLNISGNATIEAGGGLIDDFTGAAPGYGTAPGRQYGFGSSNVCSGGGHGGIGGSSVGNFVAGGGIYDSPTAPGAVGSGGGSFLPYSPGGYGGGLLRFTVNGTLQLDGVISDNGGDGGGLGGGGGSGGSISLSVGTLSGTGSISANGGSGANSTGGGGGGGMIYIAYNNYLFTGSVSAYGGEGANDGGAGTTVLQMSGKNAQFILDGGGASGPPTPLPNYATMDVILRNGAIGGLANSATVGNVLISSNASLLVSNQPTLNCSTLTVQTGGSILADGTGDPPGLGPFPGHYGTAPNYACGGGGNGGPGGSALGFPASGGGALPYYYEPAEGSGGGNIPPYSLGGAGGGAISIRATGAVEIDGLVSANGGNGSGIGGGGGAGGSILVSGSSLAGGGELRANGGTGANSVGGGGGGGSISLSAGSQGNQFSGAISAYGGAGANWGGPGLIAMLASGQVVQLILDAGGNPTTPTPIASYSPASLTLRNGAIGLAGILSSSLSLSNLLIVSNSWLFVTNVGLASPVALTLSSATIQADAGIIADAAGYGPGLGAGAGHVYSISPDYPCGGGGHGGNGGNSATNLATGGGPYDNQSSPLNSGSGGGNYTPYSLGGPGGGSCSITVSGLMQLDGIISANGGNGGGIGGGGGAGGSIKLTAGTLSGGGAIRANGGAGAGSIGGGGGGGCIAVFPTVNLFTGSESASGGGGANHGGAGTIYTQTGTQSPQLVLDNGGQPAGFTEIQPLAANTALTLRNGAIGYEQLSSQTFASLLITSNSWLTGNTNSGVLKVTITGNATVQAGGGIIADSAGSLPGLGSGPGGSSSQSPSYPCSGAGFGGLGANGSNGVASGGIVYGSITSPTTLGSGGGSFTPYSIGGSGGGAIRLVVNGALDVAGRISANGGNGSGLGGGGGSGGSISVTVGTLAGIGAITANGGNGADMVGGGGGGGRISINYAVNDFTGLIAAYGGGGYAYGGAGTIYTKAVSQSVGPVLVDNGGAPGTNTPLSSFLGTPSSPFNLTIQNGAAICPQKNVLFPPLANLTVASGGVLTGLSGPSTVDLVVIGNVDVAPGGVLAVDGQGYSQQTGPGAGQFADGYGGGAGYGGIGGSSTSAPGGASYGSAFQPTDFGSGGGIGSGSNPGGSAGGGALRLNVGGALFVDGQISAEGQAGLQNNSGGGSGGSIWITAGTLAGGGLVAANGGQGELYDGGGGAGGRIALYSRTNAFSGTATAAGAPGFFYGANGTIVFSNAVAPLQVLSNSPSGIVSNSVNSAVIYFSGAPNPNSVSTSTVSLTTPNGPLVSGLSISPLSSSSFQLNFPQQTVVGAYSIGVSQGVIDLYGRSLSQVYAGAFAISLPIIQGLVTDTNGNPLAGVTLQASAGLSDAITDTNGNYALGFVPGSTFTVTPSLNTLAFVPSSMSYTNIYSSVSNQNYTAVATLAPVLTTVVNGNNLMLEWQAIPGVTYQIFSSPDLINWTPYGGPLTGSNAPVQVLIPTSGGPQQFFSVKASD